MQMLCTPVAVPLRDELPLELTVEETPRLALAEALRVMLLETDPASEREDMNMGSGCTSVREAEEEGCLADVAVSPLPSGDPQSRVREEDSSALPDTHTHTHMSLKKARETAQGSTHQMS